jgi:hypothetical protein
MARPSSVSMRVDLNNLVICEVEWVDASHDSTVGKPEDFEALVLLHSVGYLISNEDEHVSLAMERCVEEGTFRHVTHIPRSCVKKMTQLKG